MHPCTCGKRQTNRVEVEQRGTVMIYRYVKTPVGQILLAGNDSKLRYVGFPQGKGKIDPGVDWKLTSAELSDVCEQLEEYFAGERQVFDLQLAPNGTAFQLSVLEKLNDIPYGETRSYGDIARSLGKPGASRAVGAANGRNPIPIIIPCHRVIGENGSMTGFGGGIETKRFLLNLESPDQSLF